jgi:23S rRNA (uracil1939-C5)-methyltransferase
MVDETLTVTIEKLVQGGRGLARHDSQVLFVRGAIPAETVSITGGARQKGVQDATVCGVLVPSPDRVLPPCPVYEICGGCQLQHIRYEGQLAYKRDILGETLMRLGKVNVAEIPAIIPSPNPYGYRSTIRLVVFRQGSGFALGFHREGTNEPVAAGGCLLIPESSREIVTRLSERLARQPKLPLRLESVELRESVAFGSTLVIYRTGPADRERARRLFELFHGLPRVVGQVVTAREGNMTRVRGGLESPVQGAGSGTHSFRRQRWVQGQDWIADRLDGLIFRISDRSFMQTNWSLNETLSSTVSEWVGASEGRRVLELYSGIGTLGLPLARRGAFVTEVEANPFALADARHAAKVNHIGRCRFRPLRAEAMLQDTQAGEYDVVIVDPPRTGVSPTCVKEVLRIGGERVLYLSCDAPTLARDLYRFSRGGYRVARLQAFDMFPQTAHLEILVELVR